MTGTVTVLTPTLAGGTVELGRKLYRKRILPIGQLDYKGRKLDFNRAYNDNLAEAFREGAFDTVPFQLAPDDNSHSNAVDRSAGEIVGLESTDDGLWATVSATDKGSSIIDENDMLPVSVRVVEGYTRSDGKTTREYPAALQHVLATWAPRISGMGRWEPIACAQETDEVIDLSALAFEAPLGPFGHTVTTKHHIRIDGQRIRELADKRVNQAIDQLTGAVSPQATKTPVHPDGAGEEGAPVASLTEEETAALRAVFPIFQKFVQEDEGSPTKVEAPPAPVKFEAPKVEEPKVEAPAEGAPAEERKPEPLAAAQDGVGTQALELAQVEMRTKLDAAAVELATIKAERAQERWAVEAAGLVRDYGIPPAIVAMAEPLLKGNHVVELSEGSVDASEVLRNVLHTVAKTYGRQVDLSGPRGTAHDLSQGDVEVQERDAFLAARRAERFAN
jgi:hypothetical protein